MKAPKPLKEEMRVEEIQTSTHLMRALSIYSQLFDQADLKKWLVAFFESEELHALADAVSNGRYEYKSSLSGTTSILTLCKMARLVSLGLDHPECNRSIVITMLEDLSIKQRTVIEKTNNGVDEVKENQLLYQLDTARDDACRGKRAFVILDGDAKEQEECVSEAKKLLENLIEMQSVASEDCGREYPYQTEAWAMLKLLYGGIITQAQKQPMKSPSIQQRKPRTKSPSQIAKEAERFRCLSAYEELNLTSLHPVKAINAKEVWLYNTRYKKLHIVKAQSGMKLDIKGMTLLNHDETKSYAISLRYPERVLVPDFTREYVLAQVEGMIARGKQTTAANPRAGDSVMLIHAVK